MISDIIYVCDLSVDFQFDNMFYCSILIIVGELPGDLEDLA
jgi:hypothetical protein